MNDEAEFYKIAVLVFILRGDTPTEAVDNANELLEALPYWLRQNDPEE